MKQYTYQARRDGQPLADQLSADSVASARAQLEALGYEVLSIEEVTPTEHTAATAASNRLPLPMVLEALADDLDDHRLRAAVAQLNERLQAGNSLDDALHALPSSTPRYLRGVLGAATTAGDLASVCDSFIRLRQSSFDAWMAVRRMLLYPLLLLGAFTLLGLVVAYAVLPAFADIFSEFELQLPPMTESLMFAGPYLPWLVMHVLVAWLAILLLPRILHVGHTLQTALPGLGSVFVSVSHEQFAGTLANLLRMQLPLPQALTYTGDLLEDRSLARAIYRAAEAVEHGTSLTTQLARSRQFDRSLAVLVQWGEQRSNLPECLDLAAEMFVDRRRQRLQLLQRVAPALTLVLVASTTSAIASALLIPLVKLIEGLS